ncbi:LysR family transcriptional regulator [Mesorhizobium sp. AR07]|uniref:LysR substrate-binding domain-containing protein n=1 Tax=Mesorhizobium sp. AR07 TaxID=2865838 RepID=UPI0021609396|nr:LysR substrate-binding domain-containing protein [Mesorhizobium sp. AR07]UVK43379.1 LysR family transcriptional regulator [Mesorhizobium sp. AR07]
MKLPSLNAIRAFEAAARLRSFKDAADELRLTPSAVSRHIRTLEQALGIELFERGFRQVTLTPKATHYARRLSAAFRSVENATEEMGSHGRPDIAKRASLSINATFMNLWLADRLPRFRAENPDFELDVSIHDDENRGGNPSADLRVLFTADANADYVPLVSLVIFPVCAPALLAEPNAPRTLADLARLRLLHENTTAWWEEWLEQEGLKVDAKSGPIFHDPALAVREAVNGGGVALVDNIMAQDLLASGQLVAPFPIRHTIPESYCLQQKPGNRGSAGIKRFREWLLAEIAAHKRVMGLG